jgi:hypothetical protein
MPAGMAACLAHLVTSWQGKSSWPRHGALWLTRQSPHPVAVAMALSFWVGLAASEHGKQLVEALGVNAENRRRILPLCRAHR